MSSVRFIRSVLNSPKLPKRNIPQYLIDALNGKSQSEASQLKYLWQFRKGSIRRRYATFGNNSGLKPGICWPSKEELDFMKQYEVKFEKTFDQMSKRLQEKKEAEEKRRINREKEIIKNLKKMPAIKKEFWKNYRQLFEDIEQEKIKKERVIQEVREYLGYDIDPKDPRFEEALAKKDEDEKAAMRAARKLDKQRQHLEMLQALVSEALEKEKEAKKDTNTKTEVDTNKESSST